MGIVVDFASAKDLARLKEIVLFIAQESKDDPRFGAVKLNKILYYADAAAYLARGTSITGATYQHLQEGHAPKEFLGAAGELEDERAIRYEERPYFNRTQKRIVNLRSPDLSSFDTREIDIIKGTIRFLNGLNATELSALSHNEWGWKLTEMGEEIPYRTAWLSPEPLTQEQIQQGIAIWKEKNG